MTDIVFNSGDYATLLDEAETLGFTYTDEQGEKHIIVQGPMASGGDYFLNIVGVIYETVTPPANPDDPWPAPVPRPGYWGRLRANGNTSDLPPFSSAIIKYAYVPGPDMETPGGWVNLADGTPAPDFVPDVGVIA